MTFPKAQAVHDAARFVPGDRLMAETDSPYLAPVPLRGRRNEPAWVRHVVARLAELRGTPLSQLADACDDNYHALFGTSRPHDASLPR